MSNKYTKTVLGELYRAYSTMAMELDGQMHFFFASEEKAYPCFAYNADTLEKKVVWEKGGGVMSMIPYPGQKNVFLSIKDFYLKECPSVSKLVKVSYDGEKFNQEVMLDLPFLHRFDVLDIEGEVWLMLATIAEDKENKEDWTRAGKVYVAKLEEGKDIKLELVKDGVFRNHGYSRNQAGNGGYFTSDQGIFSIYRNNGEWTVEQLYDQMVSEVAVLDINKDGVDEWITIEPFHGDKITLYSNDTKPKEIWTYPVPINFAHTLITADTTYGPYFIGGIRRENTHLFTLTYKDGELVHEVVDELAGPANVAYIQYNGQNIILSSSHTANEMAIYKF